MKGQQGRGDVVAYVDPTPVFHTTGENFPSTVRRTNCDVLCEKKDCNPKRCSSCQSYWSGLGSIVSHDNKPPNTEDGTSPSSSTPYERLSSSAKNERLKKLHQLVRSTKLKVRRLESRLKELIERDGVQLHDDDATDITSLSMKYHLQLRKHFLKILHSTFYGISRGNTTGSLTRSRWDGTHSSSGSHSISDTYQVQLIEQYDKVDSWICHQKELCLTIPTGPQLMMVFN